VSSELAVLSIRYQLLKCCPADVDQIGVIAAFKIEIRLPCQTIVDDNIEAICSVDRRHCTGLAVEKQRLDLLLTGHNHVPAKQSPELFKLNMAGGWEHRHHETIAAFEDDWLC
jgi:hypothetical protein